MIDEAANTGKGANTIISLLYSTHSLGETNLHLNADNCKIKTATVCSGSRPHEVFTQLVLRPFQTDLPQIQDGCLNDIAKAVETSASVNHAQLVGKEDDTVLVQTYDWAEYFDKPFHQRAL